MISGQAHQFMFVVQGDYFQVASFVLHLQCGAVHKLNLALPVGQLLQVDSLNMSQLVSPFSLYSKVQTKQSMQPLQVSLVEYRQDASAPQPIFQGVLISVQPQVSASGSLYVGCQCLGMPARLMFSPLADFIIAPKGCETRDNLQLAGFGSKPRPKQPYENLHASFKSLYDSIKAAQRDTLQQIFQAMQNKIETVMKEALGLSKTFEYKAGPRISDFVQSDYKLGPLAGCLRGISQQAATNQFLRSLGASFLSYIQSGGTIYQCLQDTLDNDTLLRLVPDSTGKYMKIQPSYDLLFDSNKDITLTASDMISMYPSIAAAQFMRTPGTLYVNFSGISDYSAGQRKTIDNMSPYGKYTFAKDSQAYKTVDGPSWCAAHINRKIAVGEGSYDAQKDMDNMAKLMYLQRYGKGSTCLLQLVVNQTTNKLRQCIGRPVRINTAGIKVNNVLLPDMKKIQHLYGQLKWYELRYTAAKEGASSSLGVRIGVDRFWSKDSPFSKMFTESTYNNGLYEKADKV